MSRKPYPAASRGQWLRQQRRACGWNVPEMARRLRRAATTAGDTLPSQNTMEAHVRRWERGLVAPSERYRLHYCAALATTSDQYDQLQPPPPPPLPPLPALTRQPAGRPPRPQPPSLAQPIPPPPPGTAPAVCPALLAHLIAQAITTGITCHCGQDHTSQPASGPGTAHDDDAHAHRLITEAAYQRGADVNAIARVIGISPAEVRTVLRTAGTGAWT
jgi:transcriptional regulator with XRE-family HTH domain